MTTFDHDDEIDIKADGPAELLCTITTLPILISTFLYL